MAHVLRLLLIACVVVRCMDLMGGNTAHERCSVVHVSSRRYGRDAIRWPLYTARPSPKGLDVQMLGIYICWIYIYHVQNVWCGRQEQLLPVTVRRMRRQSLMPDSYMVVKHTCNVLILSCW